MQELATASLTVPTAEQWLRRLGEDRAAPAVRLDLSSCRSVAPAAGWRVGNGLRRAGAAGFCEAIVDWQGSNDSRWFLNFTRSGLGLALAKHANVIRNAAGAEVTGEVRAYYDRLREQRSSNVHGVFGSALMSSLIPTEDLFYATFDRWVSRILDAKSTPLGAQDLNWLHLLAWEAVTNVVDHSLKMPLPPRTPGLSSITVRWYGRDAAGHATGGSPAHAQWLTRTQAPIADGPLMGFLEVLVVDDGVGIAARQSQDADIYWGPLDREQAAVEKALSAGQTVKLTVNDAQIRGKPGYGFTNIAENIAKLRGWAIARTGRVSLELDGTNPDARGGFRPADMGVGYMPGTAVAVTVPVRGNPQLDFSANR